MSETTIDSLIIEIEGRSNGAAGQIDQLTGSLEKLKSSAALTRVTNNLNKLSMALSGLSKNSAGLGNIRALADSLKSLEGLGKVTNLTSALNQLKKIPEITKGLDTSTITQFAARMKELGNALAPLSTQIDRLSTGFGRLPNRIKSCVAATNQMSNSITATTGGMSGMFNMFGRASLYGLSLQRVGHAVAGWINEMNGYIENVNLFTVSMGKYAEEAQNYAEMVQDTMGIDASEWVRNQAIFENMASGFGMAEDKAYQLSKGLTELAYDISSFYNQPMEEVFQRLQSGIAGEIEPVRRWGIALDQASMKQWMLENGISANINSLNQADKAMIRYNMTVEAMASNGAIGDFARTLITPANALRVLQQQVTQLSRALGSLFIPMLIAVLPYIQAFVKVVTGAVRALAALFGFKMPEIDYSGIDATAGGIGGVADAAGDASKNLGNAAKKAKELKNATLGFDELNVISPPTDNAGAGGGGGGAGGAGGGGGLGLEPLDVWDKSIFDAISSKVDALVPKMQILLGVIAGIGAALLAWKIGKGIYEAIQLVQALKLAMRGFPNLAAAMMITDKQLSRFQKAYANCLMLQTAMNGLKTVGVAVGGAISTGFKMFANVLASGLITLKLFGTNMIGIVSKVAPVIAIITALAAIIVYLWKTNDNFRTEIIKIWDEIKEAFAPVGEALKTSLTEISNAFKPVIAQLTTAFSDAFLAVIKAFSTVLISLTPAITSIITALGQLLTSLAPVIAQLVNALAPIIVTIAQAISKVIIALAPLITTLINVLTPIITTIVSIISSVVSVISKVIAAISPLVEMLVKNLAGAIQGVGDTINNVVTAATPVIKALGDLFVKIFGTVITGAIDGFKASFKVITGFVKGLVTGDWSDMIEGLGELWDTVWSTMKNIAKNLWDALPGWVKEGMKEAYNKITGKWDEIKTWFNKNVKPKFTLRYWKEKFSNIGEALKDVFKSAVNGVINIVNKMIRGINDAVDFNIGKIKIAGKTVFEGTHVTLFKIPEIPAYKSGGVIEDGLFTMNRSEIAGKFNNGKSVVANNMQIIKGISDGVTNGINQAIGNDFRYYMQIVSTLMSQIKSTVTKSVTDTAKNLADMGRDIKGILDSALGTIGGQIDGLKSTLDSGFSSVSSAISSLESALGDLKLAEGNESQDSFWGDSTLGEMIDSGELNLGTFVEIAGNPVRRPISRFADGGFIEDGLFTMNRGEIAGKFNNGKSVVANNEQIIEGISQGVYEAMMRASSGESDDKPLNVNVYLDGKQIAKSVEKRNNEKGRSLLGNGLGYNY